MRDGRQALLVAAEPIHQIVRPNRTTGLDQLAVNPLPDRRQPKVVGSAEIVCALEEGFFFVFPNGSGVHEK